MNDEPLEKTCRACGNTYPTQAFRLHFGGRTRSPWCMACAQARWLRTGRSKVRAGKSGAASIAKNFKL